jgi:hypothetical protein
VSDFDDDSDDDEDNFDDQAELTPAHLAAFEELLTSLADLSPANVYRNDFGDESLSFDLPYDDTTHLTVNLMADMDAFSVALNTVDADDATVVITGDFDEVEDSPDAAAIETAIRAGWTQIPEHAAELASTDITWGAVVEFGN